MVESLVTIKVQDTRKDENGIEQTYDAIRFDMALLTSSTEPWVAVAHSSPSVVLHEMLTSTTSGPGRLERPSDLQRALAAGRSPRLRCHCLLMLPVSDWSARPRAEGGESRRELCCARMLTATGCCCWRLLVRAV